MIKNLNFSKILLIKNYISFFLRTEKITLRVSEYDFNNKKITVQIINTRNFFNTTVDEIFDSGQLCLFHTLDIILLSYILGNNSQSTKNYEVNGKNFQTDKYLVFDVKTKKHEEFTALELFQNKSMLLKFNEKQIADISFNAGVEYQKNQQITIDLIKKKTSVKLINTIYNQGKLLFIILVNNKEQLMSIDELVKHLNYISSEDCFLIGQIYDQLNKSVNSVH